MEHWTPFIAPMIELCVGLFLFCGKEAPRGVWLYLGVLFVIWGDRDLRTAAIAMWH